MDQQQSSSVSCFGNKCVKTAATAATLDRQKCICVEGPLPEQVVKLRRGQKSILLGRSSGEPRTRPQRTVQSRSRDAAGEARSESRDWPEIAQRGIWRGQKSLLHVKVSRRGQKSFRQGFPGGQKSILLGRADVLRPAATYRRSTQVNWGQVKISPSISCID